MRGRMGLRAQVDHNGNGRFVVRLNGEADLTSTHTITGAIQPLRDEPGLGRVEVDVSEVNFLDSAGVRALLAARRSIVSTGAAFVVTQPTAAVADVLRILNLENLLGLDTTGPT